MGEIAPMLKEGHFTVDSDRLNDFCRRWNVRRLSVFGSALRDDFGPGSDLDFLVSFNNDNRWNLWELGDMQDEMESWFGRRVDLVQPENLQNPIKRERILKTQRVLFES